MYWNIIRIICKFSTKMSPTSSPSIRIIRWRILLISTRSGENSINYLITNGEERRELKETVVNLVARKRRNDANQILRLDGC